MHTVRKLVALMIMMLLNDDTALYTAVPGSQYDKIWSYYMNTSSGKHKP